MGVVGAADALQELDRAITGQRRLIEQRLGLSPDERRLLLDVVETEQQAVVGAVNPIWPDPAEHRDDRVALATGVQDFSLFLHRYTQPSRLGEASVRAALAAFAAGLWSEAKAEMDAIGPAAAAPAGPPAAPVAIEQAPSGAVEPTGWIEGVIALLARHYALISQALIIIGVLVIGLLFLFDAATTFATDGGKDWLKLFAWGFGAQATGVTVAQLGGKLLGSGPKFE